MISLNRAVFLTVALVIAMSANVMAAPQNSRDAAGWWEKNIGKVTVADEPLVTRAEEVFGRVRSAADSSSARIPSLLVLKDNRDPWAAAIPDGTILLSRGALAICYRGVTPQKGDARLAFILGHELAHQSKDDFWHVQAMGAMKEFAGGQGGRDMQVVSSYIEGTSDLGSTARAKEVAKVKELQADGYGIVFMTMAGYDPRAVLDKDGGNFIEEFVSQVTGKTAYEDAEHPSAAQRAVFLRTQLAAVADEVELFRVGVRYYQQGRFADAIPFFDRFRVRFPSREVFNNLGLCWYQRALEHLAQSDPSNAFRYKLPVMLDTETLASATRGLKGDRGERDEEFMQNIGEAVKYLELARGKDGRYLPARLNLASALLLAGDPVGAMAAAEDVLRLNPGNPKGIMLRAVALYEFGMGNGLDTSAKALELLAPLATGASPRSDALYNIASIEHERPGNSAYLGHLEAFLKLEKSGPYAAQAARLMGKPVPAAVAFGKRPNLKPPIPTGDVQENTAKTLQGMTKREMVIGAEHATVYRGTGAFAITRDDEGQELVEMVETEQIKLSGLDSFRKSYGEPRRIIPNPTGETLIYKDFSADVVNGQMRTLIFFAPNQI